MSGVDDELAAGAATFWLWPPVLATLGRGDASDGHRHHAMHLLVAREGRLRVRVGGEAREAVAVLTGPDVEHAIDARGLAVALLFVEPESDAGARFAGALGGPVRYFEEAECEALLGVARGAGAPMPPMRAWVEGVLGRLGPAAAPRPVHPRVRRVLRALRARPDDADGAGLTLAELARTAGLSEGRFEHAFTESMGIPLRQYLLWLKVQRAAVAVARGASLAAAAAAAGFADASHMSRSFRRMFGLTPGALRQGSQFVQDHYAPTGHRT